MESIHYVGLDVHKKTIAYCVKTVSGKTVRQGVVNAERRARQQLSGFLLRQGFRYPGKSSWSTAHWRWMADIKMAHAAQQIKARDVDFRAVLAGAQAATGIGLIRTSVRHLAGAGADPVLGEPLYRVPAQPSIDGNTVDPDSERSAFLDNALRYQASLQFVDGRIRRLTAALRGE